MRNVDQLFDETAAALQFPHYFGENWAAFAECLGDLSWLRAENHVLIIMRASEVLVNEPLDLGAFCRSVRNAINAHWRQYQERHQLTADGARPFHLILQSTPHESLVVADALTKVGLNSAPLVA